MVKNFTKLHFLLSIAIIVTSNLLIFKKYTIVRIESLSKLNNFIFFCLIIRWSIIQTFNFVQNQLRIIFNGKYWSEGFIFSMLVENIVFPIVSAQIFSYFKYALILVSLYLQSKFIYFHINQYFCFLALVFIVFLIILIVSFLIF